MERCEPAIDNRRLGLHSSPFHMSILLGILTFVLIIVSIFLVLVVLMQKSKDGGMGAALGGGAAEAAFGADTSNVLTQATKYLAILFFVLAMGLYMGRLYEHTHAKVAAGSALPAMAGSTAPAPTAPATTGEAAAPAVSVPVTTTPAAQTPAATPAPATPAPATPTK